MRILLVEDDQTVARLVRYCLEGGGHEVAVAADGFTALTAARELPRT
jgi:CheY-like chemotaxis protein